MKQELLEYIIRSCVKEVLDQVTEEEETKGATAPPADGQGSADQPPIPKDEPEEDSTEEKPSEPPQPTDAKGVIIVSPRDKSTLRKVPFHKTDDASIERTLHSVASATAGSNVKIAIATMRVVKAAIQNPNTAVYIYLGKYDPQSDEIFLMADKSLQVAKDSSVDPSELQGGSTFANKSTPEHPEDIAAQLDQRGYVMPHDPINENLRKTIKTMVNNLLDGK